MGRKQLLAGTSAFFGMLILILDGKTALEGAYSGIILCIQTVIPSLFPFFVFSILFTSALSGISIPVLKPIAVICGIPPGAESILISGFLGGYPAGAQCIAQAYQTGLLQKEDAQRLLSFCSNAGPAFLFGMISPMFPHPGFAWILWGIHISSALIIGWLSIESTVCQRTVQSQKPVSVSQSMQSALSAMASVCGWVIIFRVIITFAGQWFLWIFPNELQVLFTGLLELSNGCCELASIENLSMRFQICSVLLSFGGVCVTMQTISVIGKLSARSYIRGRCAHALLSLLLSIIAAAQYPLFPLIAVLVLLFFLRKIKKPIAIGA